MGYTHTWSKVRGAKIENMEWEDFTKDIVEFFQQNRAGYPCLLARSYDRQNDPPLISKGQIAFNGVGGEACEDFVLLKTLRNDFCKTRRKPYDLYVCAVLLLALTHFQGKILVDSDGDANEENWPIAFELCKKINRNTVNLEGYYNQVAF